MPPGRQIHRLRRAEAARRDLELPSLSPNVWLQNLPPHVPRHAPTKTCEYLVALQDPAAYPAQPTIHILCDSGPGTVPTLTAAVGSSTCLRSWPSPAPCFVRDAAAPTCADGEASACGAIRRDRHGFGPSPRDPVVAPAQLKLTLPAKAVSRVDRAGCCRATASGRSRATADVESGGGSRLARVVWSSLPHPATRFRRAAASRFAMRSQTSPQSCRSNTSPGTQPPSKVGHWRQRRVCRGQALRSLAFGALACARARGS